MMAHIPFLLIAFTVQTVFLFAALWIMIKLQKLNYNFLGLLGAAALASAICLIPLPFRISKIISCGVLLLCIAYLLFRWHHNGDLIFFEALLGFYVLLREPVIAPWIYRRAYRRRHIEPAQPCQMEFTPEHIHCVSSGRSDVSIEWAAVRVYLDKPKTILMYTAPGLFLYLPKWALSADQQQELLGLLAQHDVPGTYPR